MKKLFVSLTMAFLLLSVCVSGDRLQAKKKIYPYKISVNKQRCVVNIYKRKEIKHKKKTKVKYVPYKVFLCSPGYATPCGNFRLGEKMRWHELMGPSYGQYCSRITSGFLFHSVWYYSTAKNSQSYIQYNRLGTIASHGCVRLSVKASRFIYEFCPSGTPIHIYNAKKAGPLGKPKLKRVSGYTGWDPTDTDPNNPYHPYKKKKPSFSGPTKITLKYGEKLKLFKRITVLDSAGFKAKSYVKLKIKYKALGKKTYKKVGKISTKKSGKYIVSLVLKDAYKHKLKRKLTIKVLKKPAKKKKADKEVKDANKSDSENTNTDSKGSNMAKQNTPVPDTSYSQPTKTPPVNE